jgi:hypothetical protein
LATIGYPVSTGTADFLAEQSRNDGCGKRRKNDCQMIAVHFGKTFNPSSFHRIQLLHIDGAPAPEEDNQNSKSNRCFRSSDCQYEENENLTGLITEVSRKRDEIEIDGQQHELDTHEKQYQIASVDKDTGNA